MLLNCAPIAVDSFGHEGTVLFFCSHAHDDHLQGLHNDWKRGVVYCSAMTARLLVLRWPALEARLSPLDLGVVHRIRIGGEDSPHVELMLIDAHHVPGAVMFIFAGSFGTFLYTGDFRLNVEHAHLAALPLVRDGLTRVFIDNTFCHPIFEHPPRDVAIEEALASAALKWPCLLFVGTYKLGKEQLFQMLAKHFNTQVLVPKARASVLSTLGVQADCFSLEPCRPADAPAADLWRLGFRGCIWAVPRAQLRPVLWRASSYGIPAHGIDPTGWSALRDGTCETDGVQQIPYSDHCSFLELVQFLSLLPLSPVTFISPLPTAGGRYGYDGLAGMRQLQQHSGVSSVMYQDGSASKCSRHGGKPARRLRSGSSKCVTRGPAVVSSLVVCRGAFPCRGLRMCGGALPEVGTGPADGSTYDRVHAGDDGDIETCCASHCASRCRSRSRSISLSKHERGSLCFQGDG